MNTITLTHDLGGYAVTVPVGSDHRVKRTQGDVALKAGLMTGTPISATILLLADGTWSHWLTEFNGDNPYWHFTRYSPDHGQQPTEAQRATLARWFLRVEPSPYHCGLGGPVCAWAFGDLTPQELATRYGDGIAPALA